MAYGASRNAYGHWAVYTVNKLFNIQFSIAKGHNQKLVKKIVFKQQQQQQLHLE